MIKQNLLEPESQTWLKARKGQVAKIMAEQLPRLYGRHKLYAICCPSGSRLYQEKRGNEFEILILNINAKIV